MSFSIFPRVVYKTHSKISGEIKVEEQLGIYTLHVQGLIQSGGLVKSIWRKPLKKIRNLPACRQGRQFVIRNSLILGLGGGTVVQLIKVCFPKAKIVGVEIDPEIIKIGKKYFGLGKILGLKIIQADAFEYVGRLKQKFNKNTSDGGPEGLLRGEGRKFGLIIVDLYLGDKFPAQAEEDKFLVKVKKELSKGGIAIFNRLKINQNKLISFEKKLKTHFPQVNLVKTSTNLFFLARC